MPQMPILTANIINFLVKLLASVQQIVSSKAIPIPKYFVLTFSLALLLSSSHWKFQIFYTIHQAGLTSTSRLLLIFKSTNSSSSALCYSNVCVVLFFN